MSIRQFVCLVVSFVLLMSGGIFAAEAGAFDAQIAVIREKGTDASASDVQALLKSGISSGHAPEAFLAVKVWLQQNATDDPVLLGLAARSADLAGDFRSAVGLYKACLKKAKPNQEFSDMAADMYRVQVEYVGDADDAYQFMMTNGLQLRQSARGRRYDAWFLWQAQERKDMKSLAQRLRAVFSDKMNLAEERADYWRYLDWTIDEMSARAWHYTPALQELDALAGLIREDKERQAHLRFLVAAASYNAALDKGQKGNIKRLNAATQAYYQAAPTLEAVKEVYAAYGGGRDRFEDKLFKQDLEQKQEQIKSVFLKLTPTERYALMNWNYKRRDMVRYLMSADGWAGLAVNDPKFFASSEMPRSIPLFDASWNADAFKKLAGALEKCPAEEAAAVRAMAGGGDFKAIVSRLLKDESWRLPLGRVDYLIDQLLWPAYKRINNINNDNEREAALSQGHTTIADVAVATVDYKLAERYAASVVRFTEDKSEIPALLNKLAWTSWSSKERKNLFRDASKMMRGLKKSGASKEVIGAVDAALKAASDRDAPVFGNAPSPVAAAVAKASYALRKGRTSDFVSAANDAGVNLFDGGGKPFGIGAAEYFLRYRKNHDTTAYQMAVFKQVLLRSDPKDYNAVVRRANWLILDDRRINSNWDRIREKDLKQAGNEVFRTVLQEQTAKGVVWPDLLQWWHNTSDINRKANATVMRGLVEKNPGLGSTNGGHLSVNWMAGWASGFDLTDALGADFQANALLQIKDKGAVNPDLWRHIKDPERKIWYAMADRMATMPFMPPWYGAAGLDISRKNDFEQMFKRLLSDDTTANRMAEKIGDAFGKTRWDDLARCAPLLRLSGTNISTEDERAEYMQALSTVLDRTTAAAGRPPIYGLKPLGNLEAKMIDAKTAQLLNRLFTDCPPGYYSRDEPYAAIVNALAQTLVKEEMYEDWTDSVAEYWLVSRDLGDDRLASQLADLTATLSDEQVNSAALSSANAGAEILSNSGARGALAQLKSLQARLSLEMGGQVSVSRDDPRYPLFASQAALAAGNEASAWKLYDEHKEQLLTMLRELTPGYALWLIDESIKKNRLEEATSLSQAMFIWASESADAFSLEERGALMVAEGNLALAGGLLPAARARYQRVASAEEFKGTHAQAKAIWHVADVDRLSRQYSEAERTFEKLTRMKDPLVQADAFYGIAYVKHDQQAYDESLEMLEKVFLRNPAHGEARILEGKVNLATGRLDKAQQINNMGFAATKKIMVPGEPLRVHIDDRNLSVTGRSAAVEVRAWTASGDEELFLLRPVDDSRTKYEGEVPTVLGTPSSKDGILQLVGDDKIYYSFSEAYRKSNRLPYREEGPIGVATDAELYASSGEIVTREENERRQLEEMIRKNLQMSKKKKGQGQDGVALSESRPASLVKPGNKIYVQVIDADRSQAKTGNAISVFVAAARSGDVIREFQLLEVEGAPGEFKGAITTDSAQATAFASDSAPGSQPNYAISKGDYPAWVGMTDNTRPKIFTVDLNDNIGPKEMQIVANETGRRIKRFVVQVSLNGSRYYTVGRYPGNLPAWDGSPRLELVKQGPNFNRKQPISSYLDIGYDVDTGKKLTQSLSGMSFVRDKSFVEKSRKKADADWRDQVVLRMSGFFYLPEPARRQFRVALKEKSSEKSKKRRKKAAASTLVFTIDGVPAAKDSPREVTRLFRPGVHEVQIVWQGPLEKLLQIQLLCDDAQATELVPCPAAMFDPAKIPNIKSAMPPAPARVTASENGFNVAFADDLQTRLIRLVLTDFETDAPAIKSITLTDRKGAQVLPTPQDFMELKKNQVLEIVPGDEVTVRYTDPRFVSDGREVHERFLKASYTNASLYAAFVDYVKGRDGLRQPVYFGMRRFRPGDKINVFINDADMDTTDKLDVVTYQARTTSGRPVTLKAIENAPHSGVFVGGIFPVSTAGDKESELPIKAGEEITITYRDGENINPGIPADRRYTVEQAAYVEPIFTVSSTSSSLLPAEKVVLTRDLETADPEAEFIPARLNLIYTYPGLEEKEKAGTQHIGAPVVFDVIAPHLAVSQRSHLTVYVQTAAAREAHTQADTGIPDEAPSEAPQMIPPEVEDAPFDPTVPGTMKLVVPVAAPGRGVAPVGYATVLSKGGSEKASPLDEGRFSFSLPTVLGPVPEESFAVERPMGDEVEVPSALAVRGGDTVFLYYAYEDEQGARRWVERSVSVTGDAILDVMDSRYMEVMTGVYVGEKLYVRVIDPAKDVSDDREQIQVQLTASSGAERSFTLSETFEHSGIFKGTINLNYAEAGATAADASASPETTPAASLDFALPVRYGDTVTVKYVDSTTQDVLQQVVSVHKGSDGNLMPFTKRFDDPEMKVKTMFALSESYLELAKKHQKNKQESLARREMAQAKKILSEAIRGEYDEDTRAHAEYLLGNLAQEIADIAVNEEEKKRLYLEGLQRFEAIPLRFPKSPYASKSQFKKALVYEKMGEIDIAAEEYVKLSYRYPDNEHVPETMARLGKYFQDNGKKLSDQAKEFTEPIEAEKMRLAAVESYTTAAEVFGKLKDRFPENRLAPLAAVREGRCYLRAKNFHKAIEAFASAYANQEYDQKLRAESGFWMGHCYFSMNMLPDAHKIWTEVTWNFGETKWAKFARGQLAKPEMQRAK